MAEETQVRKFTRKIPKLLEISLFCFQVLLIQGCEKKPQVCLNCKGTGLVPQQRVMTLPFKVTQYMRHEQSLFKPETWNVVHLVQIYNQGDTGVTFNIFIDFFENDKLTHTERTKFYVEAHSFDTRRILYEKKMKGEESKCRVEPPLETIQVTCPLCGGSGYVKTE